MGAGVGNNKATRAECNGARASALLAEMMSDKLGVALEPADLRDFILNNFSRVSTLAHAIHDDAAAGAEVHASNLTKDLMQHGAADPLGR